MTPAVLALATVAVAVAVWLRELSRREPIEWTASAERFVLILFITAVGACAICVVRWRSRQMWWTLLPLGSMFALDTFDVTDLHWRWSRDDFAAVAEGRELDCDGGCDVGWWTFTEVEQFGSRRVLWTRSEDCYIALGYVRSATALETPDEALSDLLEAGMQDGYTSIDRWRDGWFEICVTS